MLRLLWKVTVGEHVAQAYQDPGTPEEQSRRQFLATATVALGGIIGVVLTVPLVASLIPESLVKPDSAGGTWVPLADADLKALENSTNNPVKISFSFKAKDGYLESDDNQFVWGIKFTPEQLANFKEKRKDLFSGEGQVPYDAVNKQFGFVIFSAVCPHLGCRYQWLTEQKKFMCPCHGSQFGLEGEYLAGPSPRGLDPLPFREKDGKAEITWIQYKQQQPSRIVISYT